MPAAIAENKEGRNLMAPRKKSLRSLDKAIADETPEVQARITAEGDRIAAKRDAKSLTVRQMIELGLLKDRQKLVLDRVEALNQSREAARARQQGKKATHGHNAKESEH